MELVKDASKIWEERSKQKYKVDLKLLKYYGIAIKTPSQKEQNL